MAFQLARLGDPGRERPYALLDGAVFPLDSITSDVDGVFLANDGVRRARDEVTAGRIASSGSIDALGLRIGAPVSGVGKVVCIGLNYRDHAAETGAKLPTEPVIFMKDPSTIVGPNDDVLIPRKSAKTDWEVELAVVIGKTARYLDDEQSALACVAGYTISNDVSEREFQLERGGQWDKGKSCETFNPLGPWLTPGDDLADPQALGLRLWVNGEQKQNGNTRDMVFGVAQVVQYVSQFMVLRPGDIINTGTPAGVALGQPDPKPYLRADDVLELEIDGLGRQRQVLRQA